MVGMCMFGRKAPNDQGSYQLSVIEFLKHLLHGLLDADAKTKKKIIHRCIRELHGAGTLFRQTLKNH